MNSIGSRLNLRHLLGLRAHRASIWRTLSSAKTTTAAAKSKSRPVVYTESKAFKYKASENFRGKIVSCVIVMNANLLVCV